MKYFILLVCAFFLTTSVSGVSITNVTVTITEISKVNITWVPSEIKEGVQYYITADFLEKKNVTLKIIKDPKTTTFSQKFRYFACSNIVIYVTPKERGISGQAGSVTFQFLPTNVKITELKHNTAYLTNDEKFEWNVTKPVAACLFTYEIYLNYVLQRTIQQKFFWAHNLQPTKEYTFRVKVVSFPKAEKSVTWRAHHGGSHPEPVNATIISAVGKISVYIARPAHESTTPVKTFEIEYSWATLTQLITKTNPSGNFTIETYRGCDEMTLNAYQITMDDIRSPKSEYKFETHPHVPYAPKKLKAQYDSKGVILDWEAKTNADDLNCTFSFKITMITPNKEKKEIDIKDGKARTYTIDLTATGRGQYIFNIVQIANNTVSSPPSNPVEFTF